jgi:Tol biopolymer transport system component
MDSELLDLELPTGIKLSPDGKSVVYSAKPNWKTCETISSIWIGNIISAKSARKLTDGTFNDYEPRWAPDDKSIAFLSDRGDRGKSCAIYSQDLNSPEKVKAHTPPKNTQTISKFEFSPDGSSITFLVPLEEEKNPVVDVWNEAWQYARLKLLDVGTGVIQIISANQLHVVDFSWSEDGSHIAYATHHSPDIESEWLHGTSIWTTEITDSDVESRELCHLPRDVSDMIWLNSRLYFISHSTLADDNSSRSVYYINLLDQERKIIKAAHGDDDCAAGLRKVGSKVLVYVQKGMEDQLRLLNSDILYREKRCILAFDAIVDMTGKVWVAFVQGSVNRPPEVFEILPTGDILRLSNHGKAWTTEFCTCTFIECIY